MKRIAVVLCILGLAGVLFWLFPLFHVVRLDEARAEEQQSRFNAAKFAEAFWDERLLPALDEAADAGAVLTAIRDNPQAAREQFGRKVGVSRTRFFVLRGSGRIVSVDEKAIGVALDQNGREPDVVLPIGLLFGNTARDATGLLDAGDFPHSQNFNDISTELNRIIEERVVPKLRKQSKVGRRIEFAGCAEVSDEVTDPRPLSIISLKVDVE